MPTPSRTARARRRTGAKPPAGFLDLYDRGVGDADARFGLADLDEMIRDPRYWRRRDKLFTDHVDKGFRMLYPGATGHDGAGRTKTMEAPASFRRADFLRTLGREPTNARRNGGTGAANRETSPAAATTSAIAALPGAVVNADGTIAVRPLAPSAALPGAAAAAVRASAPPMA